MEYAKDIEIVYKSIFKEFGEDEQTWRRKYNLFLRKKAVNLEQLHQLFRLQISNGMTIDQCLEEHRRT